MSKPSLKNSAINKNKKRDPGWHGYNPNKKGTVPVKKGSGRRTGVPNLKRTENGELLNRHGVTFTENEKTELAKLIKANNNKRLYQLKKEGALPRMVAGKPSGERLINVQRMGYESDFIIAHRQKSLQDFKTRDDYKDYITELKKIQEPGYLDEKTRLYKRNHMKALENAYGDDAKDIIMKIRMMKPEEYRKKIASEEFLEVYFVYDPMDKDDKLNLIRESFKKKE